MSETRSSRRSGGLWAATAALVGGWALAFLASFLVGAAFRCAGGGDECDLDAFAAATMTMIAVGAAGGALAAVLAWRVRARRREAGVRSFAPVALVVLGTLSTLPLLFTLPVLVR